MPKLPEARPAPPLPTEKYLSPSSGLAFRHPVNLAITVVAFAGFLVFLLTPTERLPSGALLVACLVGFVLLLIASGAGFTVYRMRAFNDRSAELLRLVLNRQFDEAERALDSAARRFDDLAAAKASCAYLLATIALQHGRFERAGSLAYAASRLSNTDQVRPIAAWSPALLVSAAALLGDLTVAHAWLPIAKQGAELLGVPTDLLARVLVHAREGQFSDALRAVAPEDGALSGMPGDYLRHIRLLQAFAHQQLNQDAEASAALLVARSGPKDEFAAIGSAWPALSGFVRDRVLSTGAA